MSEEYELKTINTATNEEDSIEEYFEIQNPLEESKLSPKQTSLPKDLDFFTKYNVQSNKKLGKVKNKDKDTLMNMISSELEAAESPITGTIVNKEENFDDAVHILDNLKPFGCRSYGFGVNRWSQSNSLRPVYPNIMESSRQPNENIITKYFKPQFYNDSTNQMFNNKLQVKFLDIEICDLKFTIHHYFSLEKLLAEKLLYFYDKYKKIREDSQKLFNDLKINRSAKNNLVEELAQISQNSENLRYDPTIRKYAAKIIHLKALQIENVQRELKLINAMNCLWSDIEKVREKQKCAKTHLELDITHKSFEDKHSDEEWSEVFNVELGDLLDKIEFDFVSQYMAYKDDKKNLSGSERKKLNKPKLVVNEALMKEQAEEFADDIIKLKNIEVNLISDNKNDESGSSNKSEKIVSNFYFKIYVDDIFVCESEFHTDKSFDVKFQDFLSVQILPTNKILTIALFENNTQTSAMNMKILDIKKSKKSMEPDKYQFKFMHEIAPSSKHIGSGNTIREIAAINKVKLKSCNLFEGKLFTTCDTNLKIGWNDELSNDEKEALIDFKRTELQTLRLINGKEDITLDKIKSLVEKVYDINLSDDDNIIESLQDLDRTTEEKDKTLEFAENIEELSRVTLLNLRNKGDLYDLQNKTIPFYESQLTTDQLKSLQKNKNQDQECDDVMDEKYAELDPIEIKRFMAIKHVDRLNNRIHKDLNERLLQKSVKDVVWDFETFSFSFRNLFRRPVNNRTLVNHTGKRNSEERSNDDVDVHITINRGYNFPERSISALADDSGAHDDNIAGFKVRSLRPFVKVYYDGNVVQTGTAIGCHPTWNQTLKINAKSDRYSSLQINVYDEHKEPVLEEGGSDQSYQGTLRYRSHNRWLGSLRMPLQSLFLLEKFHGTFKLNTPLILLGYESLANSKDTSQSLIPKLTQLLKKEIAFLTMHMAIPKSFTRNRFPIPSDGDDYIVKHLNKFLVQFWNDFPTRNIFLTFIDSAGKNKCVTQFIQPVLLPDYEVFPKNPKKVDSAKSSNISKSSSSKSNEGRKIEDVEKGLGSPEIEKDSIYSGYDRSWKSDNDLDKLIDMALRYVSLIPTYEICDSKVVTLSPTELLRTSYGSQIDHTLLLISYFMHLGLQTYVVIGTGIPRGLSSYVLTKYDQRARKMVLIGEEVSGKRGFFVRNEFSWFLYDAVKGERFELRDVSCPLKTVEYVFNNENIWINIQSSQDCENVSFDFGRSSEWRPVFDKTLFVMKQPIVADCNIYSKTSSTARLRDMLEERIKTKIQKWRSHSKTVWSRYCSTVLREILPHLEYWALHPSPQKPSLGQKLKQMMLTYKMYGFTLNEPFLNRKSIISAIKSTNINVSDDPNVEFGLAVEVYAYPNDVLSVWVFLVCLTRI